MLEYNQDQNKNFQTPMPNAAPVTDTTLSVEQVESVKPKRKWTPIILISLVGILIISFAVYIFLNKSVEKVVDEVVSTETVVENTAGAKLDLQDTLESLTAPVVLCLDFQKELSQPVSGTLICDAQASIWPALSNGYQWSQVYGSDTVQMTWSYCIYHESDPDIFCDQSGCRQENCRESIENGKQNKNEQQVSQVDTDRDGLSDIDELKYGTDPNNPDTDGDTYTDFEEISNGYNPLGEGKLIQDNTTIGLSVIQGLLDSLAKSINEQNGQAFLDILSPNNDMYDRVQADSAKFVVSFHTYFQKKNISFVLLKIKEEKNGVFRINSDILLDAEVFETNEPIFIENIEGVWKILKM